MHILLMGGSVLNCFFYKSCTCLIIDLDIWLKALATWYCHLGGSLQFMVALSENKCLSSFIKSLQNKPVKHIVQVVILLVGFSANRQNL